MDTPTSKVEQVGAKARYEILSERRLSFLKRARDSSKLTLPSLIPPEGHNGTSDLYKPFQSLGSRGVNNLSAKLLLALFPANTPFWRYKIDEIELEKQAKGNPEFQSELDEGLAKYERAVQTDIETSAIRVSAFEALKHLVAGGNCLVNKTKNSGLRVFHLDQYVVRRDTEGNTLEMILKEMVAPSSLPAKYQKYVEGRIEKDQQECELYTWLRLIDGHWSIHQEVQGILVMESVGSYPKDNCPWKPLRWTKIQGEDYGRGHVEELYGDLQSLEGLTQAIVEGSAAASKVLFLINPNGTTSAKTLATAPNGAIREGNGADVTVVQMEKYNDFRIALETINGITSRLEKAFLLNSSVQRNGERVTAEEIRFLAGELETSLGGVYAVLSQEFQLWLVNILISDLQAKKKLPTLPKDVVRPAIVTGLDALGRSNDLAKLDDFLRDTAQTFGPEMVAKYVVIDEVLKRRLTALGIPSKNLVRTTAEVTQLDQQMAQQSAVSNLGPDLVKQVGNLANTRTKLAAQPAPQAQPSP